VDDKERLRYILSAVSRIKTKVVFPIHPRTKENLALCGLMDFIQQIGNLVLIQPVGYLDFIHLISESQLVLTDSGGVQKEAFLMKKPCLTIRQRTEWVETIELGGNILVGLDTERIATEANKILDYGAEVKWSQNPFGDGRSADRIYNIVLNYLSNRK